MAMKGKATKKKPKLTTKGDPTLSDRIRAFRWTRQGMAGAMRGSSAAEVLEATGWVRSVGGSSPYLALADRAALSRDDVDRALAKIEIHELPSARGCTYVVPRADYALALRAGQGFGDGADIANAKKYGGVTDKELDRLAQKVLDAVAKSPLDPAAIKEAVGDAVRSLGPEGKKRGLTTTLPIVLGRLQSEGEIRRVPLEGRLDRQRFKYARWSPNPLQRSKLGDEEIWSELARRFFKWAAPATLAQFAWWAGLGVKAAKSAAGALALIPIADGDGRVMLAEDRDAFDTAKMPAEPAISFVGLLDNIQHPRREMASLLQDEDASLEMPSEKGERAGSSLADLPYHAIIDRGRLIGLWDYDGVQHELVYRTFRKEPKILRERANAFERWIKDELEDVRSMSLDSPEGRTDRIKALKKMR